MALSDSFLSHSIITIYIFFFNIPLCAKLYLHITEWSIWLSEAFLFFIFSCIYVFLVFMNKIADFNDLPFSPKKLAFSSEGYSLQFFCPENPDIVLDSISDSDYNKDQFLPYWAQHWPSAQQFLSYILQYPFKTDIEVCELGCGLGVLSTAFMIRKCKTFSIDISHHACRYSHQNIMLNGCIPKVLCSDWRNIGLNKRFDLIAASDIIYESRWIEPVLSCMNSMLLPDGKAWIADPCRRYWDPFKMRAKELGFILRTLKYEKVTEKKMEIEILELSRGKNRLLNQVLY
jgi:predicted nicotinamide N-methyase